MNTNPQYVMPFGRHRGEPLAVLPDPYLRWLRTLPDLRDPLLTNVQEEIARREREARATPPAVEDIRRAAGNIVNIGFRECAKKAHPDRGGTHAQMVSLNLAYRSLIAKIEGLTTP